MAENHLNFAAAESSNFSFTRNAPEVGADVDRVLFNNLVEIVPLVESLMDKRTNSSFTRRASIVYTPTPAQIKKASDLKGRKTVSAKKQRNLEKNINDDSKFPFKETEHVQNNGFELTLLKEQISNLERELLKKEEALKSADESLIQMSATSASIGELNKKVDEKEELLKSAISELYNVKIMLADKQAALEKLNWEIKMSNRKIEELQNERDSMDLEMMSLMKIFEEFANNNSAAYQNDKLTTVHYFEPLPPIEDEIDMVEMEEARVQYLAAIASMKVNPSDESLALAAQARQRLQAFVF